MQTYAVIVIIMSLFLMSGARADQSNQPSVEHFSDEPSLSAANVEITLYDQTFRIPRNFLTEYHPDTQSPLITIIVKFPGFSGATRDSDLQGFAEKNWWTFGKGDIVLRGASFHTQINKNSIIELARDKQIKWIGTKTVRLDIISNTSFDIIDPFSNLSDALIVSCLDYGNATRCRDEITTSSGISFLCEYDISLLDERKLIHDHLSALLRSFLSEK